jgi:hypothetical protein
MWLANSPHVRLSLAVVVLLLLGACGRPAPSPLVELQDDQFGFTVRYPRAWTQVRRVDAVWFVPQGAVQVPDVAEFITVITGSPGTQLNDSAIRRTVFELLPIHGVSGFQQDSRTNSQAVWYKFEVTGTSGGQEWASVGVLVTGAARYRMVACAKPLRTWRDGQRQCDEVVRAFQPGNLR